MKPTAMLLVSTVYLSLPVTVWGQTTLSNPTTLTDNTPTLTINNTNSSTSGNLGFSENGVAGASIIFEGSTHSGYAWNSPNTLWLGSQATGGQIVFVTGTVYPDSMRIDQYGQVGIGTSAPQTQLEVAGSGYLKLDQNGRTGSMVFGNNTGAAGAYSPSIGTVEQNPLWSAFNLFCANRWGCVRELACHYV